jgi:hypothetical protein
MRFKDPPYEVDLFKLSEPSIFFISPPVVVFQVKLHDPAGHRATEVVPSQSEPRIARPLQRISAENAGDDHLPSP